MKQTASLISKMTKNERVKEKERINKRRKGEEKRKDMNIDGSGGNRNKQTLKMKVTCASETSATLATCIWRIDQGLNQHQQ
jgi:hypothetical protein